MDYRESQRFTTEGPHSPMELSAPGQAQSPASLAILSRLGLASTLPPAMKFDDLIAAQRESDWRVRIAAVKQLGSLGNQASLEAILTALEDEDAYVRAAAVRALGSYEDEQIVAQVTRRLIKDRDWYVRETVVRTLGKLGERAPIETFLAALNDEDASVRAAAVDMLGMLWKQVHAEKLVSVLQDRAWVVREAAVLAIGSLGENAPLEPLQIALRDSEWQVRESARVTLEQTHPEVLPTIPSDIPFAPKEQNAVLEQNMLETRERDDGEGSKGTKVEPLLESNTDHAHDILPPGAIAARPAHREKRFKRFQTLVQSIAALLIVALLLGGFLVLLSSHYPGPLVSSSHYHWCIIHNLASGFYPGSGAAAISDDDVWAVGSDNQQRTSTEHWNGKQWQIVASPSLGKQNNLNAVAAVSSTDVWAVGVRLSDTPGHDFKSLIEHWNGKGWSIVPSPNQNVTGYNRLDSVTAISANDVWAAGWSIGNSDPNQAFNNQTLIEHWNGKRWTIIPNPNPGPVGSLIYGMAAISATDIWAVGQIVTKGSLIEHWNGKQWSIVAAPNPGPHYDSTLAAVAAISANDIWAIGGVTEHWDGKQWKIVASAATGNASRSMLRAIATISTNDIWAVGGILSLNNTRNNTQIETLAEHWDGKQWSTVPSPNVGTSLNSFSAIAVTPGKHIWAVGMSTNEKNVETPLIATLCAS